MRPWLCAGEQQTFEPTQSLFVFNRENMSWHYGWTSNRHTCNSPHALLAYVFRADGTDAMTCVARCSSPEFVLFCRRRRRFELEPRAPIAEPNRKKQKQRADSLSAASSAQSSAVAATAALTADSVRAQTTTAASPTALASPGLAAEAFDINSVSAKEKSAVQVLAELSPMWGPHRRPPPPPLTSSDWDYLFD
jgi:hypothetical protein